jgi:hypothetical protein
MPGASFLEIDKLILKLLWRWRWKPKQFKQIYHRTRTKDSHLPILKQYKKIAISSVILVRDVKK